MENHYSAYRELRQKVDSVSEKLTQKHKSQLQCKIGCDLCCMDYSSLPVEFYSMREELKAKNPDKKSISKTGKTHTDDCVFLKDHACTIYESRPIICRTHGLPLLYAGEDGEWELSTCELNFRDFDYEEFTEKNTFPQDVFNSKLFMLNRSFISGFKEKNFGDFELIPLRKLTEEL